MRCRACNKELSDREATHKDPQSGDYFDLCSECLTESYQAMFENIVDKTKDT